MLSAHICYDNPLHSPTTQSPHTDLPSPSHPNRLKNRNSKSVSWGRVELPSRFTGEETDSEGGGVPEITQQANSFCHCRVQPKEVE